MGADDWERLLSLTDPNYPKVKKAQQEIFDALEAKGGDVAKLARDASDNGVDELGIYMRASFYLGFVAALRLMDCSFPTRLLSVED